MPKCIATDISPVKQARYWLDSHPCPKTGSGNREVHKWLLSAANACRLFELTLEQAADFLAYGSQGCGRNVDAREIDAREIREAIETAYNETVGAEPKVKRPKVEYRPEVLAAQANQVGPDVNAEWLQANSPISVSDCSPAKFLCHLYEPGERVFIGTIKNARKPSALYERADFEDFDCLDDLKEGHEGVWFLSNPVTGEPVFTDDVSERFPNGEKWRTEANVTAWRYMVIESDEAPSELWIRMLVQLELKIVAIYTSGARSIHALVRVDQPSKEAWDKLRDSIEARLVTLGADPGSLTAVRLTRLPGCMRNEPGKTGIQRLLYLDPNADGTQIIKKYSKEETVEETEAPTVAIHTYDDKQYCSIVINGELKRVTPDDPSVSAINDAARELHEIEQSKGFGVIPIGYAIMGLSAGLRGDQLPRFYELILARERSITFIINDLLRERPDEPIMSFGQMTDDPTIKEKEGVVSDLIRKEDKTVLASGSKAYKTWNLVNLSTSVVAGAEWLGFPCKPGRVLIINFELHKYDLRERILKVATSKGISRETLKDNLHTWNLRGRNNEVDQLVAELIRKVRVNQYDMIIFDPTYKMLGDRSENDAAEMTQLVNKLEEAAVRLKVAVVFAVHFPKGDMSKRQAIDRMAGSGVFGRDPDTIMIMSELTDKERKELSGIKAEPKKAKEELSGEQKVVLKKLTEPSTHGDWLKMVKDIVTKDSFNNTIRKLQKLGYVEKLDDTGYYAQTEKGEAVKLMVTSPAPGKDKKAINPSLIGAQKIEFTLRNRAPQESIVVKFNLEKCIHEVLPMSGGILDEMDAEKDVKTEPPGRQAEGRLFDLLMVPGPLPDVA